MKKKSLCVASGYQTGQCSCRLYLEKNQLWLKPTSQVKIVRLGLCRHSALHLVMH